MSVDLFEKCLIAAALGATVVYALGGTRHRGSSKSNASIVNGKVDRILDIVTKVWNRETDAVDTDHDVETKSTNNSDICKTEEDRYTEEDDYFHVRYYSSVKGMGILKKISDSMTAADLMYDRVFAKICKDTSAIEALGLLAQHRTSCLCVEDEEGKLRGILDITDVTSFLTQSIVGTTQPIHGVLRHCAFVKGSMPLNSVVAVMQRGWAYVAVEGTNDDFYDIVSQGLVLRYVYSRLKDMKEDIPVELYRTIHEVFEGNYTSATCIHEHSSSRNAFNTMLSTEGRCILVTEEDTATPKGVLSMSDIKILSKYCDNQSKIDYLLSMPVYDFVETSRSEVGVSRPFSEIVQCLPSSSLMDVLDAMVTSDVHNVYIIDETQQPIGIISTSDLLRVLV